MHMISNKDLNSAELGTVTTSRSRTTVVTAIGEVQTHEEATLLRQRIGYILDNESPRKTRQQYCRSESFSMNTDTHTSGSKVKNHFSLKKVFGHNATRRTSYRSWFLVYQRVLPQACLLQHPWHLQCRKLIIPSLPQARLPHHPWHLQLGHARVCLDKNGETRAG